MRDNAHSLLSTLYKYSIIECVIIFLRLNYLCSIRKQQQQNIFSTFTREYIPLVYYQIKCTNFQVQQYVPILVDTKEVKHKRKNINLVSDFRRAS